MTITYYLDVLSQWCFAAEDAIDRVRSRFADDVIIEWRIAWLANGQALGYTRDQLAWYLARGSAVTGRRFTVWLDDTTSTTAYANLAAESARALGVRGDSVRRALAHAGLIEGQPLGQRDVAVGIAARSGGLDSKLLSATMDEPATLQRLREDASEFASLAGLGIDQRPAFVFANEIGDRVAFSGVWRHEPLLAAAEALLGDERRYKEYAAGAAPFPQDAN